MKSRSEFFKFIVRCDLIPQLSSFVLLDRLLLDGVIFKIFFQYF